MANRLRHSRLVFQLSCWVLGLIAFGQLLTAGVALASRMEKAQEVRIVEKIVPQIITLNTPAEPVVAVAPSSPAPKSALPPMPDPTPLPPPRDYGAPPIADPVVERLVTEARKARMADDMGAALTKLLDAQDKAPADPSVLYELAVVYEEMAASDSRMAENAADLYQQILSIGTPAGTLYFLAAEKLEHGISMPADQRGAMELGRPRIFKDDDFSEGERVVLTVPVHAAPGTEIGDGDMEVRVTFFDSAMQNGKREILKTAVGVREENVKYVTLPFDFAGGEELVRFTYILPPESLQDARLFGRRSYYGQIVELVFKGEVLDTRAWPRHLSSRASAEPRMEENDDMPQFLTEEDMMVLPTREGDFLPEMPNLPNPDGSLPPPPED
jgi:hypothetical protein